MNKYQASLNAYNFLISNLDFDKTEINSNIQELVDKATPKRPIHRFVPICFNLVDYTYCPNCVFAEVREYEHHCHCGQAIDWSNDEI